jgi:hypothetical protein
MADYAGAIDAIRARFVDQWKIDGAARTLITFPNEPAVDGQGNPIKMPPKGPDGAPVPWVYFEVIGNGSDLRGAGSPGDHIWLYRGGIFIHVFVPEGSGTDDLNALAIAAGEIFRATTLYADGQGRKVVCMSPSIRGGGSDADRGNVFGVTCFIPFEYFHRG